MRGVVMLSWLWHMIASSASLAVTCALLFRQLGLLSVMTAPAARGGFVARCTDNAGLHVRIRVTRCE
jgi:hypothetical protein